MTSLGVALSEMIFWQQWSQSVLVRSDGRRPDGVILIPWDGGNVWLETLLSLTPWQSHIVPDLPNPRVQLLKLQQTEQRESQLSTQEFCTHTALCPWPLKLLLH